MTAFLTCRSCVRRADCSIRTDILAAIKGLRITTLRHSCASHALPYEVGQAVWAKVQQCPAINDDNYYGRMPSREWFPAHFLGVSARSNTRGLVFIPFEAPSRDNPAMLFYPVKEDDRGAVCKVMWTMIEPRDAPNARSCPTCHQLEGMKCEGPGTEPDGLPRPCPMTTPAEGPTP